MCAFEKLFEYLEDSIDIRVFSVNENLENSIAVLLEKIDNIEKKFSSRCKTTSRFTSAVNNISKSNIGIFYSEYEVDFFERKNLEKTNENQLGEALKMHLSEIDS